MQSILGISIKISMNHSNSNLNKFVISIKFLIQRIIFELTINLNKIQTSNAD